MSGFDNTSYTVRTTALAALGVTANDSVIVATLGTAKTGALPSAVLNPGRQFSFINANAGTITLTPAAGLVDGAATSVIALGSPTAPICRTYVSDGVNWYSLNDKAA